MSINAITKYDQLIFSNFWDKGDQIIGSCCGPYADIIATTFLLLSNFIIISLSFTHFTPKILSIHFTATSIATPVHHIHYSSQSSVKLMHLSILFSPRQCLSNFSLTTSHGTNI